MKNQNVFIIKREVRLNMKQILAASIKMLRSNGFVKLANALPKSVRFSAENRDKIKAAMGGDFGKVEFDKGIIFPAAAMQEKIPIDHYKKRLADRQMRGLPVCEQYTEFVIEDGVEKSALPEGEAQLRRSAYLWLYSSSPIPQETKGLTFSQEKKLFSERKWNGMSLIEYYFTQRHECKLNRDHRFDAWDMDKKKSQLSWLLALRCPSGGVRGAWDPSYRLITVAWIVHGLSSGKLGARPAIVVPLEL